MRARPAPPLRHLAALLALATAACGEPSPVDPGPGPGGETQPRDVTWLRANAVPFRTAEPGGDLSDLAPLKGIVGGARLVALGEATHGTKEFFQMKHRVLEYLVKEMGFSAFAIEATWAECNRINDYVHGAPGDPRKLLSAQKFWTWNTQEVLDMIEWMRRHNQNPGDAPKVSFYGFDMQYSRVAMDEVEIFLERVDPVGLATVRGHYACYRNYQESPTGARAAVYRQASAAERELCRAGVLAAYAHLQANRDRYVRASSAAEYERALRAARIVVQNEDLMQGSPAVRDPYMAENAAWLLEQVGPGGKIVLWAHNFHVANRDGAMGLYLRQRFAAEYLIAGFSFAQGSFNAFEVTPGVSRGLRALSVGPVPEGSYEHHFQRVEQPRFLLDLRPLRGSPPATATWLRGPLAMRIIGAAYNAATPHAYFESAPLPQWYDVVIHFSQTSPSVLLPFVL